MSTPSDTASPALTAIDSGVCFYDYRQLSKNQRDEIVSGLKQTPKRLPCKYFYDDTGLALQQQREAQPDYYLDRIERMLLAKHREQLIAEAGDLSVLIEYGSGGHEKTHLVLETIRPKAYVPMDLSKDRLYDCAIALRQAFPTLEIHATCLDYRQPARLPQRINPLAKRIAFCPNSNLGHFTPEDALTFLQGVRNTVGDDGALLIGLDLEKDSAQLTRAYDDDAGLSARLNLNILHHINQLGSGTFNPDHFQHRAFYNEQEQRVEMQLVSELDQVASVFGERIFLKNGETITTELAYKFRPDQFLYDVRKAGFLAKHFWTDDEQQVGVFWLEAHQLP